MGKVTPSQPPGTFWNGVTAWTGVGDAGRHDDSLPGVQRVWDTVNGNLSGALQDGGHGVPGGGVGTDGLARIKGEQRHPHTRPLGQGQADDFTGSYPT